MSELQQAVGSQQKWVVISKYLLTLGRPKTDAGARWHRRGNYYSNCVTRPHIKFPMASQIVKDIKGIRPDLHSSRAQCTHARSSGQTYMECRLNSNSWCCWITFWHPNGFYSVPDATCAAQVISYVLPAPTGREWGGGGGITMQPPSRCCL